WLSLKRDFRMGFSLAPEVSDQSVYATGKLTLGLQNVAESVSRKYPNTVARSSADASTTVGFGPYWRDMSKSVNCPLHLAKTVKLLRSVSSLASLRVAALQQIDRAHEITYRSLV